MSFYSVLTKGFPGTLKCFGPSRSRIERHSVLQFPQRQVHSLEPVLLFMVCFSLQGRRWTDAYPSALPIL